MLIDNFRSYLDSRNIQSTPFGEGNTSLSFTNNGLHYIFDAPGASDPYFFRLLLPGVEQATVDNVQFLQQKALRLSSEKKVAKAYILGNSVWISADCFVYGDSNINQLFERVIYLLEQSINSYRNDSNQTEGER